MSALPPLEQALLTQAQERFVTAAQKGTLTRNGTDPLTIRTLHGAFVFAKQRLRRADETDTDYLEAAKQPAVSAGLEDWRSGG
jgi:hypothetical protein